MQNVTLNVLCQLIVALGKNRIFFSFGPKLDSVRRSPHLGARRLGDTDGAQRLLPRSRGQAESRAGMARR
jgi:hypothetical protein